MRRPDFDKCTELATQLLYKQDIRYAVLNMQYLKHEGKEIYFDTIQNYATLTQIPILKFLSPENNILRDGCTLILGDNKFLVLYNDNIKNFEHLNWTLAHEIGHIYLGHTKDGELEEVEAHFFAAQLFMPEYSIYMMSREHGKILPKDLVEIFGVSPDAAKKRIRTMNRKFYFRASSIDKEIWTIQKQRVDLYYECEKNPYIFHQELNAMLEFEENYLYDLEEEYRVLSALGL